MKTREKRYWIGVACLNHINRGLELGMFGIGHGKLEPLERMQPNDMILFYAPKIDFAKNDKANIYQKFKGFGEITNDEIFTEEISDRCVFRRKVRFLSNKEVDIHELIGELDFIKDKKRWGFPFMRGYLEITEKDFATVSKSLK